MALTPQQAARLAELQAKKAGQAMPAAAKQPSPMVEGPSVIDNVKSGLAELPGFAAGALNKTRETTSQPILRALAKMGFGPAQKEMEGIDSFRENHTPAPGEKAGGVAADAAMMMTPLPGGKIKAATGLGKFGLGLARAFGVGAQGAAQHQAQNYSQTGEIDPGEAAIDAAAGTALMGAGKATEPAFKWLGVKALQGLTRAPKNIMKGVNKPTAEGFEQALENRLVPINPFNGGFGVAEKRGMALQGQRDKARSAMLDAEGIKISIPGALKEAERNIQSRVAGSSGLLPEQQQQAISQLGGYLDAAKAPGVGMNRGGFVSGSDAIGQRKMADANARFIEGKTKPGLDLASQTYRESLEDQLLRRMAGKGSEAEYVANKAKMAQLSPIIEAFGDKAISNYSYAPELISGAVGSAAAMGSGNLAIGMLPVAATAARRYPGTAPIFYEAGRAAGNPTVKRGGKAMLDLGRATTYGVLKNED